jgi:eukaryotic-like serine/threonine-protein kinase
MSVSSKCPSRADLHELLEGNTADSDQAAVVAHLDECSCCQQSLEALANGDSSFAVTLLEQAAHKTPEPHSAYWPALQQAEKALTVQAPAAPKSSPEISLAFLSPPEDDSYLGSLGNFHVVRVVGRGGMGMVFHATDTCLQRDVAIKVLDPELSKDELAVTRFCREARAAASISHENVVAVHQVERDEDKNLPFLVMELISGESLEKKLERDGRLSLKEIVSIGMQAASGLAAAHATGLIHRDIKPGNILLEKSGQRVKLTDFGLARAAEDVRLTRSGLVAGTPLYMSPEQATGEEVDGRSDLFSLGVVLYELAAGEPPFNGKTPLAVLKRVTEEQPVPLRQRNPDLPEWFVHIVDRLLAKKPADRFQSAREVADTLEHFWVLLKSSETLICPKKKAANFWKAIALGTAAGLLTLMLGAAFVFFLLPHRDGPNESALALTPVPLHVLKGNAGPLWSLAVSKDGRNLAMGTDDGTVKFWDIAAEKVVWTLNAHKGTIWSLALSPQHLATASDDGPAKIWDLDTRQELHALANSAGTRAVAFDPDGKRLLTGGRNGTVKVWDALAGKEVLKTAGHAGLVGAVAFAPDGKTIASAGGDKTIKIWDAISGQEKVTLHGHQAGVYGIAFSPNGRFLVSGSWDKTVRLWELASGTPIATLTAPTQDVWSVDFNAQGTLFAATGEDQMVRIWDFESKKEIAAFRGSSGAILNVRFVSEPGLIVAAGKEGDARLWRVADLKTAR